MMMVPLIVLAVMRAIRTAVMVVECLCDISDHIVQFIWQTIPEVSAGRRLNQSRQDHDAEVTNEDIIARITVNNVIARLHIKGEPVRYQVDQRCLWQLVPSV